MIRALQAIVYAVVIAASLLTSAASASANTLPGGKLPVKLPPPAHFVDVTWE